VASGVGAGGSIAGGLAVIAIVVGVVVVAVPGPGPEPRGARVGDVDVARGVSSSSARLRASSGRSGELRSGGRRIGDRPSPTVVRPRDVAAVAAVAVAPADRSLAPEDAPTPFRITVIDIATGDPVEGVVVSGAGREPVATDADGAIELARFPASASESAAGPGPEAELSFLLPRSLGGLELRGAVDFSAPTRRAEVRLPVFARIDIEMRTTTRDVVCFPAHARAIALPTIEEIPWDWLPGGEHGAFLRALFGRLRSVLPERFVRHAREWAREAEDPSDFEHLEHALAVEVDAMFEPPGVHSLAVPYDGDVRVSVGGEGLLPRFEVFSIRRGEVRTLVADLEPEPRIAGSVLDAAGGPLENARVHVLCAASFDGSRPAPIGRWANGTGSFAMDHTYQAFGDQDVVWVSGRVELETDAEGRFDVSVPMTGRVVIAAYAAGHELGLEARDAATPTASVEGIVLRPRAVDPRSRRRMLFTDLDGEPLREFLLVANHPVQPHRLPGIATDRDGWADVSWFFEGAELDLFPADVSEDELDARRPSSGQPRVVVRAGSTVRVDREALLPAESEVAGSGASAGAGADGDDASARVRTPSVLRGEFR